MLYRKVRHPWRNFAFRDKLMVSLHCAEWFDDEPEEFYVAWIYYMPGLMGYSIPGILRLNDFQAEAHLTFQSITEQNGTQLRW
jgi:hypothetical protein